MTTRQELYDRIRQSSKDAVILEEMIRLGFWPQKGTLPEDPADEIRRQGELQAELRALRSESSRLHNEAALKKEAHRRRLAEAKLKREETKQRREQARREKAEAWTRTKASQIVYLGPGVSRSLQDTASDETKLGKLGLPVLTDAASVASAMGITIGQLRFLAFDRKVSRYHHYQRFFIPKKTGGDRLISAPLPRLKEAQRWVLDAVLDRLPVHPAAHGFVPGRSICTNARPHVGQGVVVNVDLKDFFPSVSWVRVRGLLRKLGYSRQAATILALLCTERDVDEVELDGTTWYVACSERVLPQGSPASPGLTNALCRRLDARLAGLAKKHGFTYTRYADDLTFSHPDPKAKVGTLLAAVRRIVADEDFAVHPDKTRVMRNGRRQEVTGLVVNDKLGIERRTLRRFRALLFQIERDGPDGKHWGPGPDLFSSLIGYASYVTMVDPAKGTPLLAKAHAIAEKHHHKPTRKTYPKKAPPPKPAPEQVAAPTEPEPAPPPDPETEPEPPPKKKWWQFWK